MLVNNKRKSHSISVECFPPFCFLCSCFLCFYVTMFLTSGHSSISASGRNAGGFSDRQHDCVHDCTGQSRSGEKIYIFVKISRNNTGGQEFVHVFFLVCRIHISRNRTTCGVCCARSSRSTTPRTRAAGPSVSECCSISLWTRYTLFFFLKKKKKTQKRYFQQFISFSPQQNSLSDE